MCGVAFISLSLALFIIINCESTKVLLDKTDYPVLDTMTHRDPDYKSKEKISRSWSKE